MKGKLISVAAVILIIACGLVGALIYFAKTYYTQVDNSKIQKLSGSGDMAYEYALDCYDENGGKKEWRFKTKRELREGAYLSLEIRSAGVYKWEEVSFEELPQNVQDKYQPQ